MEINPKWKKRLAGSILLGVLLVALWPQGVLAAEIQAIRFYQTIGSPVVGLVVRCHYQPTCSHYALQVLQSDGLWRGNFEMVKRVLLCSPIGLLLDRLES